MKYYHKGEDIIASDLDLDLPEATYEEWQQYNLPTKEEIKQMRKAYRHEHIDDNTAERSRKMANGSWTEEDEAEYLALDAEVTAYIEENLSYPEE